ERHARALIEERGLDQSSLVVEIGSNDGYLLRTFAEAGVPVLGIDPATGPAEAARRLGIPTVEGFFDAEMACGLRSRGVTADVLIANNVMAHVPDLGAMVEGIRLLRADDGVATIENPSVRDMLVGCHFDTV